MTTPANKFNILWLLDPFESVVDLNLKAATTLRHLQKKTLKINVTPVFLQTSSHTITSEHYFDDLKQSQEAVESLLRHLELDWVETPRILSAPSSSKGSIAEIAAQFAKEHGADLVLTSTHAYHGIKRFLTGSLVETLVYHSPAPLLVLNAQCRIPDRLETLIFATDFSEKSYTAFCSCVEFSKKLGLSMRLFHQLPEPVEPIVSAGINSFGGVFLPVSHYFEDLESAQEMGEKWVQHASDHGLAIELVIGTSPGELGVIEAILRQSEIVKNSFFVAAAQSGPLKAAVQGSILRELIRHAWVPLLAFTQPKS